MNIKKYKKLKDNRYQITLDNLEQIVLYDDIILKYNLLLTKKIKNEEQLEEIKKDNASFECYYKAIHYLSYKMRCQKEIANYLKKLSYSDTDIQNTIKLLKERKYIDEENYITAFINDQILMTHYGPKKIKNKLIEKGLNKESIDNALNKISLEVWKEKLEKIIKKKIMANKKESKNKLKEKILSYCLGEGYSKNWIMDILNSTEFGSDDVVIEKEASKLVIKLKRKYTDNDLVYHLKMRLLAKGFFYEDVENVIIKYKENNLHT